MQRTIDHRTGAEGPRHDPYSWTEYTMTVNNTRYTLRLGALGYARLLINREKVAEGFAADDQAAVISRFEGLVGMPLDEFERAYNRAHLYFDDPMGSPGDYV